MSSERQRNRHIRKSKRVILLAFEGNNKTEKNYFSNFAGREKEFIIKMVPGNETDPENLVKQTAEKAKVLSLSLEEDDKAYCIFDADINPRKNKQIESAIHLAKKNNIIPIVSTPCIELWFLLHYEYRIATISSKEVINKLRTYYPRYQKNEDVYLELKEKMPNAIKNAKKLEKYHLQNNKKLQAVETNPYTEIYKIIEELQK